MRADIGHGVPILVRGIRKSYGRLLALKDISLDIRSGEFITLLGPSGSGKTTLLMVLAGFVRPDAGELLFGNQSAARTPPHRRNLGVVFQNYALFPHMSVFSNIAFPLRLRKISDSEIESRVERTLQLVHLAGFEKRRVDELSGGERQRVALARAIVFQPRILLMDEPLSALDKKLRERMQVEIRELHEELGITTVYVTHDQREALTMSDRIAVIDGGRLRQLGTPREIYEQPNSRFVADFIGEFSVLPLSMQGGAVLLEGQPLKLAQALPPRSGEPRLLVRPEQLEIVRNVEADDGLNRITGTVSRCIYQGESFMLHVVLAGGEEVLVRGLCRHDAAGRPPDAGQSVVLGLHPANTTLIFANPDGSW